MGPRLEAAWMAFLVSLGLVLAIVAIVHNLHRCGDWTWCGP